MKGKKLTVPATVFAVFFPLLSFSGEIVINNSEAKKVCLFRTGAEVTRSATASIPAGNSTLAITGLSPYIDHNTISVEGSSAGKVVILGVSYRNNYIGPEKMLPEVALLQDSLDALTKRRLKISSQLSVCQEEQNLLLANKSIGGANTGIKTEDLRSMAGFFRERLTELREKMLDLTEKENALNKEINKISRQIEDLKNRRNPPPYNTTVLVEMSAEAASRVTMELRYFTTFASWNPLYDVKVEKLSGPVSLDLKAQVTQDTWENWEDVSLTISTADVSSGNTKPELYPWYLNFAQPVAVYDRMMGVTAPSAAPSQQWDSTAKLEAVEIDNVGNHTTTQQNSFATEYSISQKYSIPSDGKPHTVLVKNHRLDASYKYHAIPKIDTDVFVVAHVTGWQELGLLSGPSSIYYEGAFVGNAQLNTELTEDTLLVSLGRDAGIQVSREKLKDVEGNKTIGGNRVKEYKFEITLKNTRKESVAVILTDQLPVSMDKDIEVKSTELSGAAFEASTGELKWIIEVPGGQQLKKVFGFTIKYPKEKVVSNL